MTTHHEPMTNDLFDDWHAIGIDGDFPIATVKSLRLLARDLVAWRSSDGQLRVWDDRCPHRGAKLSQGQIQGNRLIEQDRQKIYIWCGSILREIDYLCL
jgi:phenylpropionate dioxygenase-like ring-hydroxylating dioxygenase large terminal subunit